MRLGASEQARSKGCDFFAYLLATAAKEARWLAEQ
jgi:hypothetical protein